MDPPSSLLRAMEEAWKASGRIPWLNVTLTEAIKAWFLIALGSQSHWFGIVSPQTRMRLPAGAVLDVVEGLSSRRVFVRKFASEPLRKSAFEGYEFFYIRSEADCTRPGHQRKGPDRHGGNPPKPVEAQSLWCRHVSLIVMPYRRAKSLLLSLYTSVLTPFTSSTTSLPSST